MTSEPSEFGAGVVVCLVKFSEHLWNWGAERTYDAIRWSKLPEADKEKVRKEAAEYPHGDASRFLGHARSTFITEGKDVEKAISDAIEIWMNGASDHFYDLDRERAPRSLVALADLTLSMGHGFTGKTWTEDHIQQIRDLWQEACLEIDKTLGTSPDWGQW